MIYITKEEFEKLYQTMDTKDLAKKLDVSIGTLYRYAKKYDCHKKRGGKRKIKII